MPNVNKLRTRLNIDPRKKGPSQKLRKMRDSHKTEIVEMSNPGLNKALLSPRTRARSSVRQKAKASALGRIGEFPSPEEKNKSEFEDFHQPPNHSFNANIHHELTENQIASYKELFAVFDKDGSGGISRTEFKQCFKNMSMLVDQNELKEIISSIDEDADGDIEWEEFIGLMQENLGLLVTEEDVKQAFKEADTDNNLLLEADDVRNLMEILGEDISIDQATMMVEIADTDEKGSINMDEFQEMIMSSNI